MLYRSFGNSPDTEMEFQTIKEGQRKTGTPDYSFFSKEVPEGKFLIGKETIGHSTMKDCTLEVFPDDEAIRATRPLFIFRDPRETLTSWLKNNLIPIEAGPEFFIQAYRHTYKLLLHSLDVCEYTSVITYDALCADPERHVREICRRWDLSFHSDMLAWKDDFLATADLDADGVRLGHYADVAAQTSIRPRETIVELSQEYERAIDSLMLIYDDIKTRASHLS